MSQRNAKINWVSTTLFHAATLALVILPLAYLYGLAQPLDAAWFAASFPGVTLPEPLPDDLVLTTGLAGALPLFGALYVLWQMRRLFQLYRRGETLGAPAAVAILRIGAGLLATLILGIISHSLQILVLTLRNPPGERALSIAFSSQDFGLALAGGLMLVIGWVMREAVAAAEENRSFV